MISKKRLVAWYVNWTHGWNSELHLAIESKVMAGYKEAFPDGAADAEMQIKQMREFYYGRMAFTGNLLVAGAAVVVSVVATIASVIALFK